MKQKRDRIFVIVLGLVLANLAYYFAGTLVFLYGNPISAWHWAVLTANGVAIIGILWLLRAHRLGRKEVRDEQRKEQE